AAVPAIRAIYDMLARYPDGEVSRAALSRLPEVQRLVSDITRMARLRATPLQLDATIIIPVHNKLIHTLCCLNALLIAEARSRFEVIVADDVSTDATPDVVSAIGGIVRHLRNVE